MELSQSVQPIIERHVEGSAESPFESYIGGHVGGLQFLVITYKAVMNNYKQVFVYAYFLMSWG